MGNVKEMPNRKMGFTPHNERLEVVKSIVHGQPITTLEHILEEQRFTLIVCEWLENILTTSEQERGLSPIETPDLPVGLTLALANRHLERLTELGQHLYKKA
ncbi:MAG: hypothetical protein R3B95_17740 [Nitrospirales bacterium]|nr:hypothetical protein [Nitrospirales bacterium]